MLYREIIAVCSEIHRKHINTLCGQNVELLNVKPGGTYSNHWALKGWEGKPRITPTCDSAVLSWLQSLPFRPSNNVQCWYYNTLFSHSLLYVTFLPKRNQSNSVRLNAFQFNSTQFVFVDMASQQPSAQPRYQHNTQVTMILNPLPTFQALVCT
jgi:hypothetical protein